MSANEFRERISARAANAGVALAADAQSKLETYFELLARWNAKINLTALPLDQPTDETFDRLLIEPLVAARHIADSARSWLDVGSGAGSPAIPLKILHPRLPLTMIESRTRKAAFLREAVRTLELEGADVADQRFEDFCGARSLAVDLVSVRAVRSDPSLLSAIQGALSSNGRVFFFHSPVQDFQQLPGFIVTEVVKLGTAGDARLTILKPVFHVEQRP